MAQAFPGTFEAPRLVARLPRETDAALLFAAYTQDARVTRYLQWQPHRAVAEAVAFISDCLAAVQAGSGFPYMLATRDHPDMPIGMLDVRVHGELSGSF